MTFVKLLILFILCILAIKIAYLIINLIRTSHIVIKVFISPLKRIYIWEYNNFKTLLINLFLQKSDIFKSLTNKKEVGVVRDDIGNIIQNNILSAIFHLLWQILGIIILSTRSLSNILYLLSDIKQHLLIGFISIIISIIYIRFKTIKITSFENTLLKSTMPFNIKLNSKDVADE
jgi:hypothetical protein